MPNANHISQTSLLSEAPHSGVQDLKKRAPRRAQKRTAAPFVPERLTLSNLWEAAQTCKGCDLYKHASQAVVGDGRRSAHVMLVGEQPGDQEDIQGKPFVGPAGKLLDKALEEAGIDRGECYVTNAVKHFKFIERGKRRLHQKPKTSEVNACRPWLEAEIKVLSPEIIVALGATAAQSLLGSSFRLTQHRGEFLEHGKAKIMATMHPAAILRAPDAAERDRQYKEFVEDLKAVKKRLKRR